MWMDIYNALGRDRTLFVARFLDEEACNQLIASLIWLQGLVLPFLCSFTVISVRVPTKFLSKLGKVKQSRLHCISMCLDL